ncbi:unnamed protein product [Lymnaea stagnalis]|uniref:AP-5 complex subunit mu-1 n=1 Tax=Lymnaea stagnalis TaxID=6523 RepID=A0AAV2ILV8_LYMST
MMNVAVRNLWVIKLPSGSNSNKSVVLHTRKFPLAEKKDKLLNGQLHVPVPPASQLVQILVQELAQAQSVSQFVPSRDRCDLQIQKPVHQITTDQGILWPIVAFERAGILYCCLPVVDGRDVHLDDITKTPIINIPSVSLGFALLGAVAEFLKVPSQELPARLVELPAFINEAAPFGILRDGSAENIISRLADKPCAISKTQKIPAWKSSSFKGKPSLQLSVTEYINASQCAQETWHDSSQVFGSVNCRAEFEGAVTDITVNLSHLGDGLDIPLDLLLLHPCVQRADWQDLAESNHDTRLAPRRIRFSPPAENFTICHYTVKKLLELPVFGVYQMKPEDTRASITVQLKLNDQIKNNFEYCELHIPFYTRAPILSFEGTPTQGSVMLSSNKKEIVWNIGKKSFPFLYYNKIDYTCKDQQALLAATVTFSGTEQGLPAPTVEDAFCRGNNSYAQLVFKIQDFTHSGCGVDAKSVQVSPTAKFKMTISREYSSIDYKIWNSIGDALTTL